MYIISIDYIKEKWAHGGFQKYFRNTGWVFAAQVFSMGASLIATTVIARKLGPENFGQLSYATSYVGIFSILATLGIDYILYRDLIKYPEKRKEYLGSAFVIKLIAGSVTAFIVIISSSFSSQNDVSKILILILSGSFIFNPFQIINYEFQARVQSKYPSIISFLVTTVLNFLKVIVILSNNGVIYLAFVLLLGPILNAILYWYFYENKLNEKIFDWRFDKQIAISLLKDSWPLIFTGTFGLIYARIDQVIIKNMIDATSVGIYSVAVTLAEIWGFIPTIITLSLFPAVINAKKTSEEGYHSRLRKIFYLLLVLALFVSVIMTIIAPFIIKLIYGSEFINSVIILQIYVWSSVSTFLAALAYNYLITENYKKIIIFMTFIPMVINIMLNLIWIPVYGIIGSAYATLLSYSFGPITLLLFKDSRKDIKKIFLLK